MQRGNNGDNEDDDSFPLEPKIKKTESIQRPVTIGTGDINPIPSKMDPESGMFLGPSYFQQKGYSNHPDVDSDINDGGNYPFPENKLPKGAHPSGARFDPITPFGESASGEPDNDELMPPPNRNKKNDDSYNRKSGSFDPFNFPPPGGGSTFFK